MDLIKFLSIGTTFYYLSFSWVTSCVRSSWFPPAQLVVSCSWLSLYVISLGVACQGEYPELRSAWVWVIMPVLSCVTIGKAHDFSELQLLCCSDEDMTLSTVIGCCEYGKGLCEVGRGSVKIAIRGKPIFAVTFALTLTQGLRREYL